MKKILLLLAIYMSMGFTARKNKTGEQVTAPDNNYTEQSYGYLVTTSPEVYTITLQ